MRDAILTGKLTAGEKIVETKLAADLQVSRSPVREAIRLLTMEQLLVEQDGMICVFQPSIHDFNEIYELRLAVEPAAARRAARLMQPQQLGILERNLEETRRCLEAGNMERLLYLNTEFHQFVWKASGNSRFIRILNNLSTLIHYYCLLVLNINNQQTNILSEHTEIYQAIKEGNEDTACSAMFRHITKDLDVITSQAQAKLA